MTLDDRRRLGDRYTLGPVLGRGGTAVVHEARDERLGRPVAVKLLGDVDPAELGRHRGELNALARLSHPNVVVLHDAGSDDEASWLALELVQGRSLATRLADGPLDEVETARIGAAVARGTAAAHSAGIVHRDIKPGNVLLGDDGQVKVTDFGIAHIEGEARSTRTGTVVGTAAFLSPEQVEGAAPTPAADVYALGLVLLECLTGHREYTGSAVEQALARLNRDPDVPARLSEPWQQLLRDCTSRHPLDRPSAAEVADRLEAMAARIPAQVTVVIGEAAAGAAAVAGSALPAARPAKTDTATWPSGEGAPTEDEVAGEQRRQRSFILVGLGAAASLLLALLLVGAAGGTGSDETPVAGPSASTTPSSAPVSAQPVSSTAPSTTAPSTTAPSTTAPSTTAPSTAPAEPAAPAEVVADEPAKDDTPPIAQEDNGANQGNGANHGKASKAGKDDQGHKSGKDDKQPKGGKPKKK